MRIVVPSKTKIFHSNVIRQVLKAWYGMQVAHTAETLEFNILLPDLQIKACNVI